MLRFASLVLAAALSACATAPPGAAPIASASHRPAAASRAASDPATALLRAGTASAMTIADARALFGAPDVERRDGAGALLVWTLPTCALTLGFANDRLQTVTPGPRRTGDPAPSLQTCTTEARARAGASS
jgi:hypothetical protein